METSTVTPEHRVVREFDIYFTALSGAQVRTSPRLALLCLLCGSELFEHAGVDGAVSRAVAVAALCQGAQLQTSAQHYQRSGLPAC